ncbi:MAG TPA: hypothetical protein VIK91_02195 [Nannocystis sp.]
MSHRRLAPSRGPRSRSRRPVLLGAALAFGAVSCEECIRGKDEELDCSYYVEAFEKTAEEEGILLDEIPDKPSFPMALAISEAGIAELLKGVTGDKNPVAGGNLKLFGLNLEIIPKKTSVKLTSKLGQCSQCVIFSVDFTVQAITDGGTSQAAGTGSSQTSIPLRLEERDDDTTVLVAAYDEMKILDLNLRVMGFDTSNYPEFERAVEIKMTELIREQSAPAELMRFQPWTIGTNSVKVAAKRFAIFPDAGVIVLGMQTNLDLPPTAALKIDESIPDNRMMRVQMHPGLLFGMAERMMVEGEIPRRYDDDGKPDENGAQAITLTRLTKNALGPTDLDVVFRVWRTKGSVPGEPEYCGYADAVAVLRLGLADTDSLEDRITVTPTDDLYVLGGRGVGDLYEDNQEYVDDNKDLVDYFKRSLADQIGITVNYNELAVDGQNIIFDAKGLTVSQASIDILLDFLVLAAPEGG